MEPPSQRRIEQCDRAVGSVHRAEDMEIGGQCEFFAGIGKGHSHLVGPSLSFVLFQKRDQFAQHLGDVGAVDFIDYLLQQNDALLLHQYYRSVKCEQ